MVEVTTTVEWAGHLVTVGAQLVTVTSVVVKTVMVVSSSESDEVVVLAGKVAAAVVAGAWGRAATTAAKATRATAYFILILGWRLVLVGKTVGRVLIW